MGQAINKLYSVTMREVKMINIERRAEKVISKEKPTPAPLHPSSKKELERLKEENVSTEFLHKKDEKLDEYLKKVFVTSHGPPPPLGRQINPNRPLPVNRSTDVGITYGYSEIEEASVPEGKVSLKQALTFISNHQNDPKKYSSAAIASEYKIPLADTNDILEYFKMFSVRVEKKEVDPEKLSAFEKLQLKVKNMNMKNLPETLEEVNTMFEEKSDKKKDVLLSNKRSEGELPIDSAKTIETTQETNKTINEEKTGKEEKNSKREADESRVSTIKRSQENG